jgi:hypothetical protein
VRGKEHRGAANELALPFAQVGLTTEVRADILVQVAEPPRRDAPAISPSAKAFGRSQVCFERLATGR